MMRARSLFVRLVSAAVAATALALAAESSAPAELDGRAQDRSACAPPQLGFGVGEGANDPTMPPSTGELRVAMLFVDFAEAPGAFRPESIADAYIPTVVDWYKTVSYGQLQISVKALPQWIRLPRTFSEYQETRFEGAAEAAVAAADPLYDFSGVDALFLITSTESGSLASAVIDHEPLVVDGAAIHGWVWFAAGSPQAARTIVLIHETGHILGLPDLYDVRRPAVGKHRWDVMAAGGSGGMFAWHRWKLGWLAPGEVVCLTRRRTVDVTLAPVERPGGVKAVVYRAPKAAIVVEVRQRLAEDASICRTGVLAYRVDFVKGAPATFGRAGIPIDLWPARPGKSSTCGELWRAPFALGRGNTSRTTAFGVRLRVLRALPDGSYRVRFAPTRSAK